VLFVAGQMGLWRVLADYFGFPLSLPYALIFRSICHQRYVILAIYTALKNLNNLFTTAADLFIGVLCFYLALANLTSRGTCIVMYYYNESQRDALFIKFI
jgi:hypothetical protein